MDARPLSADLSVGPQITTADVRNAAAAGIRTIICTRPDGEAPGQPDFAEIAAAAAESGIEARHLPVVAGRITETHVDLFGRFLEELPRPVLAYCRTGTRAAMLWALAMADSKPLTDILAAAQAAGCDVSSVLPRPQDRATNRDTNRATSRATSRATNRAANATSNGAASPDGDRCGAAASH